MDRMRAAMMGEEAVAPQTGGAPRRPRRPRTAPRACQPRGGPRRRRLPPSAPPSRPPRTRSRARHPDTRERRRLRDGGRGEGGPQAGRRRLRPRRAASPAAKKRKTGKAATASAAADSDDDVRIIGETFGRPTSVVEDVDDDEDVDVDAYLASRGVYVTSLTDRGPHRRRGLRSCVTYDPDVVHPRDRDAQGVAAGRAHARAWCTTPRWRSGGTCPPCGTRPRRSTR